MAIRIASAEYQSPVFAIDPLSKYDFTKYEDRETYIKALVAQYSAIYRVSDEKMWNTLKCENRDLIFDLQSQIVSNGKQEQSYGISQIHLPSHPDIKKEQATNPEFAVNFMAKSFSKGEQKKWSCYRLLYN